MYSDAKSQHRISPINLSLSLIPAITFPLRVWWRRCFCAALVSGTQSVGNLLIRQRARIRGHRICPSSIAARAAILRDGESPPHEARYSADGTRRDGVLTEAGAAKGGTRSRRGALGRTAYIIPRRRRGDALSAAAHGPEGSRALI